MGSMWKPWQWSRGSQASAVANARAASTELSRRRVEREEVELFLRRHASRPDVRRRPLPVVTIATATRPA